jgi:hypothetical protein
LSFHNELGHRLRFQPKHHCGGGQLNNHKSRARERRAALFVLREGNVESFLSPVAIMSIKKSKKLEKTELTRAACRFLFTASPKVL